MAEKTKENVPAEPVESVEVAAEATYVVKYYSLDCHKQGAILTAEQVGADFQIWVTLGAVESAPAK
jgi:predicted ester cyclase